MPRSRWFALLVAALLCVLGGANRGKVPAHEREGSRTADEPAALSMRRGKPELEVPPTFGDADASLRPPHIDAIALTTSVVVSTRIQPIEPASSQPQPGSTSPRGPPHSASLV